MTDNTISNRKKDK